MGPAECRPLRELPNLPVLGRPPDATEFLERLFASVGDEPAFLAALETLADWYGASTMALNEFDHRTHTGRLVPVRGFGAPLMRAYMEHYAACNVWLVDADRKLRTGDLGVSHVLYPDALLVHTEWYTDFVRPQGVFHSMGAVIVCQDGRTITTPILREESAGNYTEDEQTVLRSLAPFLEQAFRLQTRLLAAESYRAAACSLLESLATAVFFLDAQGRLVGLNAAARDLALQQDGVAIANGQLLFESHRVHATLSMLLRGLGPRAVDAVGATGTVLRIDRPSGRQPYIADFVPLARLASTMTIPRAEAALLVSDPDDGAPRDQEPLRRAFGLSPTESRLASLLVAGCDLVDAAEEMNVSLSTVRTHLQHIFSKTGVNRQADLIRLVLRSLASVRRARATMR